MIVKNEAPVIRRCLDSVRPFIDRWVIVDTGSTDGTQQIIRSHFADVPGQLHERPWRDFAFNRNEALALARDQADYLLFIDADEMLRAPSGLARPSLAGDGYFLHTEYGGMVYSRCALVSTRLAWSWVGVLHEYLTSDPPPQLATLEWPRIVVTRDGARARDPDTYRKDAAVLEAALKAEPGNTRYAFYLAQSYRDCGDRERSIAAYRHRVAMGGWEEESFEALYEIGKLSEQLKLPVGDVQAAYLAAYQFRPHRAEPLFQLARFHRERNEFALAYMFARQAVQIPWPQGERLFVDSSVYLWRSIDELSVAASYTGALDEGKSAVDRLLAEGHVPPPERPRIEANHAFYEAAIAQRRAVGQPPGPQPATATPWTLWIPKLPGYPHHETFIDIARGLQEAFAELGSVVPIVNDASAIVGRALVLGPNLLPLIPGVKVPDDAVLFNLEQISDAALWVTPEYLSLLRRHEVWDYSERNIEALRRHGIDRVRQCAIGYAACLTRIPPMVTEDIDVLFYGSVMDRREKIIDTIAMTGLRVHCLTGAYGPERDAWIARSKIVVNLHAYPEPVLEIARISYLLANRRFVISEPGPGVDRIEAQLHDGVVWGTAEELPALCLRYAADEAARRRVAEQGFALFRDLRQVNALRSVLES